MVSRLSSSRTTSATSRATSVPLWPIAIPISAALSAGPSLMPSPVIATILPAPCSAWTICSLWAGLTLANTCTLCKRPLRASESMSVRLVESRTLYWISRARPSSFPIAYAVGLWSPVSMVCLSLLGESWLSLPSFQREAGQPCQSAQAMSGR